MPSPQVLGALDEAFAALDNLPDALRRTSLGQGFCFLIAPLPDKGAMLPETALQPGGRLRLLLSDLEDWGTDGNDGREPAWQYGDCELSMFTVPPGRDSLYLPTPYRELYEHKW